MFDIVKWPDDRLTTACKPVEEFDTEELRRQCAGMMQTMFSNGGIGLAANQVGFDNRVIIVAKNPDRFPNIEPMVMVNPRFIQRSQLKRSAREGCLSFPGKVMYRTRSKSVMVEYRDVNGERHTWKARGLQASCIQHEVDHLNGKTFLEK